MNEHREAIKDYAGRLANLVKGSKTHTCLQSYRIAGALEVLMSLEGLFEIGKPFDYLRGGKKYLPLIGDFTWVESYPHFILRKANEYLNELQANEQN